MQKTNPYYRSFSFRAGLLIFVVLCTTLVSLRVLIFYQSINETYKTVRLLIDAHADEIGQDIESIGPKFVLDTVDTILSEVQDSNLYIGIKTSDDSSGNFSDWTGIERAKLSSRSRPTTLELHSFTKNKTPLHLYLKVIPYAPDTTLVVGYNLKSLDYIRHSFTKVLIENIGLAFLISLLISLMIIWVMNRHFKKLNDACTRVISGDISYRIASAGQQDQFEKLAWNINRMLDWNNALISTVQDSTNAIAHDMRTPLSRLRLKLSAMVERKGLNGDVREELADSVAMLDRLVEMFENILRIARAESRSNTNLFEQLDLHAITRDIVEFYQTVYEEKNIRIKLSYPDHPIFLYGDKQLLSQAILNLFDNACKYTPAGGTLSISLHQSGEEKDRAAILSISDSGPGIPDDLILRAKDRFFRADTSRHDAGYGLGLSLVNAVATLHHGTLNLTNLHPGFQASLVLPIEDRA